MTMPAENVKEISVVGPTERLPVAQTETSALISMIERLARDPSVDLERIERMMELRRQIAMEEAEAAFNESMSIVQGKMRAVAADANNPQTRSRYASYFALDKAIRPIYSTEGIGLSFDTEDSPKDEHVRVVCYVTKGKYTRKYHVDMPADGKGAKGGDVMTKTHAAGSAFTYGQRYLLKMIFNIAIGDDDDGNSAGGDSGVISQDQIKKLEALISETETSLPRFLGYMKIESLDQMPAKQFQRAVEALNAKKAKS